MNRKKVANYVRKQNKALSEYKIGPFHILIKDPIKSNIDIRNVFKEVNNLLPSKYTSLLDVVYIGDFSFLVPLSI